MYIKLSGFDVERGMVVVSGRFILLWSLYTALDPAEPYFKDDFNNSMRLDKSDATFVDVIHSDGDNFNLLQGTSFNDWHHYTGWPTGLFEKG